MAIDKDSRVLIADDFGIVRIILKKALFELGIQWVDEACDGEEAFELLEKADAEGKPYGVAFLDWNMPGKTGDVVLEMCRKDPRFAHLPIIIVTAESEQEYVAKALAAGASDYIIKPFSSATLKSKIESVNQAKKAS